MVNKISPKILMIFALVATCCSPSQKNESPLKKDINGIKIVYLDCNIDEFNKIYTNYKENTYIPVTVTYDGKIWPKVKLRIRGDSSRKLKKKSLKLKFSKTDLFIQGVKKINLNAEWYDKTYMNQYLSSHLMRKNNINCFNSEHIVIYLNNKFYGIYLMIENLDKQFLKSRNINNSVLYKATKDGACFNDSSEVDKLWEKKISKKNLSKTNLKNFITASNNLKIEDSYQFYKNNYKYKKLISLVALNILTGNKSTYYHNYYLMHNTKNNKWEMLPWDLDKTMMKELVDLHYARTTWSEGYNSNLPDNPIPEYVFLNENMKKDLQLELDNLIIKDFNLEYLSPIIDSLALLFEPLIALDTTDNISSVNEWEVAVTELKDYIKNRPAVVKSHLNNYPSSFEVYPPNKYTISWSASNSATEITYEVKLCTDKNFKETKTFSFKTEKNTVIIQHLPKGEYFYYVNAINKFGLTTGFRIKNKINIP